MLKYIAYASVFFYMFSINVRAQVLVGADIYIDKGAEMYIEAANTIFDQANIITDRSNNYGLVAFGPDAQWSNADHNAHVNGYTRMFNEEAFSFPSGHDNIFQPLRITRINQHTIVDIAYSHIGHSNLTAEIGIEKVSDEFYWTAFGDDPAYVSLSWNSFSNIDKLTDNNLDRLGIAGYDGTVWRIIEAGLDSAHFEDNSNVSLLSGSITSKNPVFLEGYDAFTLVAVGAENILKISQGFTPNGDGINDTWYIENIENYPNAKIYVYSRWDREVYTSLGNYQNDWNGIYKNNQEPVPDGSYAYVIDLDGDDEMDLAGWIYVTR